ncbi:nitroreductase family protein [Marinifilum caeruleilacunae]|uniref:SagB/ThcOx family dehydrogenase n=1 Tax=Marinifilum caeruleilacunae TaxID=2499076 RepID=A0ABX1WQK0_9BACT|nr:nitroreductase family protein [Marinifilum caeruleilacunae]NOU58367.1 SagB/ThcOx family dehydrogenase [Marinifilum caeruleilacunae]
MKKTFAILLTMGILNACTSAHGNRKDANTGATAIASDIIKLDQPNMNHKASLMEAFHKRKSTRSFAEQNISKQDLSNLLWAAGGINRKNGGRTVPLLGDISIYVAMQSGVYQYQPVQHELKQIISEDIRDQISEQSTVKKAPLVFIYAIDDNSFPDFMSKAMKEAHGMDFYYGNQTAYSTQNVYLYACSNKMNAVVIGGFKREFVDQKLMFDENKNSYLIQLVGYSK